MKEGSPPRMAFCQLSSRIGLYDWKFEREHPPLGQVVFRKVATDEKGNTLWCTGEHEGPCLWPQECKDE